MRDEELTPAGIRPVERHADRTSQVRPLTELVADREAGSAFSVAARITALHDEIGDHAMKRQAVEELLPRQRDEGVDGLRCVEHGELDLNQAAIHLEVDVRRHRWI